MTANPPTTDQSVTEAMRCAWAKINLTLHVTGRRPSGAPAAGYHELDSLIVFAGVGDELRFRMADAFDLRIEGPFAANLDGESDNLVLKAARLLAAHPAARTNGRPPAAAIRLTKNLPVAAGIGGGSADAAATLLGLRELWKLPIGDGELATLALTIGADLPICLSGLPSFVGGIGEDIALAPSLPDAWLLLVNPLKPLSTPAVFAERKGAYSTALRWEERLTTPQALADRLAEGRNDLEAPACKLVPEIANLLEELAGTEDCLLARMSGSGATCFGLYGDEAEAKSAAATLRSRHPDWWIAPAPMRTR